MADSRLVMITQDILDSVTGGEHTVILSVEDSDGNTTTETITFEKKTKPVITLDGDLGVIAKTFNFTYQVLDEDGDSVDVVAYIDNVQFYSATPTQGTNITVNVSAAIVNGLSYGTHNIYMQATDSNGNSSYAESTFTKVSVPSITVVAYQGHFSDDFDLNYTVSDEDSSDITMTIYLDNMSSVLFNESISIDVEQTFPVDISDVSSGLHTLILVASDGDVSSRKDVTFYRDVTTVDGTGLKAAYLDDAWDSATHPKRLFQQGTDVYDGTTYYTFADKTPYTQEGEAVTSSLLENISHSIEGFISKTTTVESDGTIVEKTDNGIHYTKVNSNGSITETWIDNENNVIYKDSFVNSDGSVSEVAYL